MFGWLAFRSRVTGVYLSIITQALTYALMLAFFRNDMGFGGNNGFTDFKDLLGFDLQRRRHPRGAASWSRAWRWPRATSSAARSSTSRAGTVLIARSATPRAAPASSATGRSTTSCWVFVVSAVMAGVAGALYVPQVGIINPSEFAPINSIEIVIWVAVGGRGTLSARRSGAVLVNYAKTCLTGALPEAWLYALGALFVLVTLFLPRGLVGLPSSASAPGGRRHVRRSRHAPKSRRRPARARDVVERPDARPRQPEAQTDAFSTSTTCRQLRRLQGAATT